MSCTEIYTFNREGTPYRMANIHNAWRGAMAVWRAMEERYLPPKYYYGHKMSRLSGFKTEDADEVWGLFDKKEIPEHERIVLGTTFDKCLVRKENLPKVIEAFRKFGGETSLPEQAEVLEKLMADDDCIAVGWNQTSVNGSDWLNKGGYNEETDENIPYNCKTMTDHFWLIDEVNEVSEG